MSTTTQLDPDHGGVQELPPTPPGLLRLDTSPSASGSSQTSSSSSVSLRTPRSPFPTPQISAPTQVAKVILTVTSTPTPPVNPTSTFRVPTEHLSQMQKGWPHTQFGRGRRNEVKTWGLTGRKGRTVAKVRHRVLRWSRPVWRSENKTEVLESWRPTFAMGEGWAAPSVTSSGPMLSSSSTASGVGTSIGTTAPSTSLSSAPSAAPSLAPATMFSTAFPTVRVTASSTSTATATTEVTLESSSSSCAIVTGRNYVQ